MSRSHGEDTSESELEPRSLGSKLGAPALWDTASWWPPLSGAALDGGGGGGGDSSSPHAVHPAPRGLCSSWLPLPKEQLGVPMD